MLDFWQITPFLGKTPLKTQNDHIFQNFVGVMVPLAPLATPMFHANFSSFLQVSRSSNESAVQQE